METGYRLIDDERNLRRINGGIEPFSAKAEQSWSAPRDFDASKIQGVFRILRKHRPSGMPLNYLWAFNEDAAFTEAAGLPRQRGSVSRMITR